MLIGTTTNKTPDYNSVMAKFLVLDLSSSFNAIIRGPSQVDFNLPFDFHSLTLMCETPRGNAFIYAPQLTVCNNYVTTMTVAVRPNRNSNEDEPMKVNSEPRLNDLTDSVEVLPRRNSK